MSATAAPTPLLPVAVDDADAEQNPQLDSPRDPLIGVILVNWNAWHDTLAAHRSLQQSACTRWSLIVVDDASTDDSAMQLAHSLPQAVLVSSPAHAGFAGACNLGLRAAQARGLQYAFLLNNSAQVLPDTLGALLDASAALQDGAVLGSVVRHAPCGSLQFFGSRTHALHGGPDWYRAPHHAGVLAQALIESDFVVSTALFMPMQIVRDVGELDERFFVTYEETDWCYRARARGWRSCVVPASVVQQACSPAAGEHEPPMRSYFLHRNRLLFSEKHAAPDQRCRVLHQTWRALWADLRMGSCTGLRPGLRTGLRTGLRQGLRAAFQMSPRKKAVLWAARDYLLRRFGDCPPEVRRLSLSA